MPNIGGSFFGIQDDNQFYCTPALASTDPLCAGTTVDHTVSAPNLADQLTAAGMTWRGYFQNLPPIPASGLITTGPNANGPYTFKSPSNSAALYAFKHKAGRRAGACHQAKPARRRGQSGSFAALPSFLLAALTA